MAPAEAPKNHEEGFAESPVPAEAPTKDEHDEHDEAVADATDEKNQGWCKYRDQYLIQYQQQIVEGAEKEQQEDETQLIERTAEYDRKIKIAKEKSKYNPTFAAMYETLAEGEWTRITEIKEEMRIRKEKVADAVSWLNNVPLDVH